VTKQYDRAYFDRWYRARRRVVRPDDVRRSARLALATAEYVLGREVRTVLDVGCGEGSWRPLLRRARPRVRYTGVDPSPYAVARFGQRRDVRAGTFATLGTIGLRGPYDLIVCADVLHYVEDGELTRGLPELVRLLRGVAWIQVFAADDVFEGDIDGWHPRSAAWYRRTFNAAGLVGVGINCWSTAAVAADALTVLELP
jgi:SAM-dependent methyltransferase